MNGNEELIAGAAWMAGKAIFPMESLSFRPNIAIIKNIKNHIKFIEKFYSN